MDSFEASEGAGIRVTDWLNINVDVSQWGILWHGEYFCVREPIAIYELQLDCTTRVGVASEAGFDFRAPTFIVQFLLSRVLL
ncbi:MAG TPA: hypothetical protein VK832_04305 [Burkholderiaceae bacterium]|jgi:hypothetical protein|nr:hypothetical protein [Burkholderiaceae bacterium]